MSDKLVFYTDRSAVETDDACGMKYWFSRLEGGRGIVPKDEALALMIGRETHLDLRTVALMPDLRDDALKDAIGDIIRGITPEQREQKAPMEYLYRRLGWLAAFALYVEPTIRERYENVSIEQELILNRDPLFVGVTPDRLLKCRVRGHLEYREYKTTISASNKWMNSWPFAIQLHIGLAATQEALKSSVHFAQVMGLMKGERSMADDRLVHPYAWGYYNRKQDKWAASYESARGDDWSPMPVWEYPAGIVEWVKFCGPTIAAKQFPHSVPVFYNKRMLDDWIARRVHRERQLRYVGPHSRTNQQLRGIYFERRTNRCRPSFGDPCPYLLPCWNAEAAKDPIGTGEFVPRIPHHEIEVEMLNMGLLGVTD